MASVMTVESALVDAVRRLGEHTYDADTVLDALVAHAEFLLGADEAAVNLAEQDRGLVVRRASRLLPAASRHATAGAIVPLGVITREAMTTRRPVVVANVRRDCRLVPDRSEVAGVGSSIALPLYVEDCFLGMLFVNYREPGAAAEADLDVAMTLASHAAAAIRNARLNEESTLRLKRLAAAQRVSAAVNRAATLDTVLDTVLEVTDELVEAPHAAIALVDPDRRYVRGVRGRGLPPGLLEATVRRIYTAPHPDEDMLAVVVRTGVQQSFPPNHRGRHKPTVDRFRADGLMEQHTIVTPIVERSTVFGVLTVNVPPSRERDPELRATLRLIAEQAAGAIGRERMRGAALQATRTEALLAAIVSSADDAIMSVDLEGRILSWNPAAERLYGYTADEVVGKIMGFVFPHERRDEPAAMAGAIARGETLTLPDTERVRKDGSRVPVSITISPVRAPDGQLLGAAAFVRDLTEAKRAARAREEFERLERFRALGQLAGGIVHDVNHALGLVVSHADLASFESDPEKLQTALDTVTKAAMGIGETMQRLLRFARAIPEEAPSETAVEPLLREVVALTAPRWRDEAQAEGRRINLYVKADRSIRVHAWSDQLRGAVVNLVLNAVDALPRGGTIALSAAIRGSDAVIEVRDDGMGMPPEVQERLFEPFFTTKGTAGTGLGLTMVRTAIEQHGGTVEVESAPGHGTTFRLMLPRAIDPDPVGVQPAQASPAANGGRRILLVEDEPQLASAAAELLTARGYKPTIAHSGEQAVAMLATTLFDAVLCDLGLGEGSSGWDVVRAVRERSRSTRLVLATGWSAGLDDDVLRAAGVDAVLSKPYGGDALVRALTP